MTFVSSLLTALLAAPIVPPEIWVDEENARLLVEAGASTVRLPIRNDSPAGVPGRVLVGR